MHTVVTDSQLTFFINVSDSSFTICSVSTKTIQIHVNMQNQLLNYQQHLKLSSESILQ